MEGRDILRVFDVDLGLDCLPHRMDRKVQPIPAPSFVDMTGSARNMVAKLVKISGDPAPRFLAAQFVRKVDVDRSLHL